MSENNQEISKKDLTDLFMGGLREFFNAYKRGIIKDFPDATKHEILDMIKVDISWNGQFSQIINRNPGNVSRGFGFLYRDKPLRFKSNGVTIEAQSFSGKANISVGDGMTPPESSIAEIKINREDF